MQAILLPILAHLLPLFSGILTTRVMDVLDDGLKLTASWPDSVKRALVAGIAAILPVVGSQVHGLAIPSNPADLLSQPFVQVFVSYLLALIFKTHAQNSAASATASAGDVASK